MIILKRLFVILAALISLFTTPDAGQYADNYSGHEFPIIAAESQKPGTVRVMSYNIRCWDVNGEPAVQRTDPGARQIMEVMPDSVGIQEATPQWMEALDKKLIAYDWVGLDREEGISPMEGGEACPIFYLKSRFKLLDSGTFWLSDTPDVPSFGPGAACRRICTWAKLQNRVTKEVYVHVNSHFDHKSEAARAAGAEIVNAYIAEHFADVPVVFTADMNASSEEQTYATMTSNLCDASLVADKAMTCATFHGGNPETHTDSVVYTGDYVLCSPNIHVREFRVVTKGVDGRFTSDHFPIYADMIMPKANCKIHETAVKPFDC